MDPDREESLAEFRRMTLGKKVALAGASGVGKSTILNRLIPHAQAETGKISSKSERGNTRHVMRSCFLSMRNMAQ